MNKPLVIAHRGASSRAPENTMASFRKAVELGADAIELDVHRSKDGYLMVCHDERVDRTSNGKGYIKDFTLRELKLLDAGGWFGEAFKGEKMPLLEEVLELVSKNNILLNIELKNGPIFYEGIERDVINLVKSYGLVDETIISSFNHYSLLQVKSIEPRIKTGILYIAGMVSPWEYAKIVKADAIHPLFFTINKDVVLGTIRNGIMVNPFAVDKEGDIELMNQMGVSGIITNYPDVARKIVDKD